MSNSTIWRGVFLLLATAFNSPVRAQEIEAGNRITVLVKPSLTRVSAYTVQCAYQLANLAESKQKVWQFYVLTRVPGSHLANIRSTKHWGAGVPERVSLHNVAVSHVRRQWPPVAIPVEGQPPKLDGEFQGWLAGQRRLHLLFRQEYGSSPPISAQEREVRVAM